MTKLEYEKRKRMKTLAVVAVCTAAILFALAVQESYAKSSLWVSGRDNPALRGGNGGCRQILGGKRRIPHRQKRIHLQKRADAVL